MREDLFELAEYAKGQGLIVSLTPSATPRVTEKAMRRAKEVGLDRWAFSLDGSTAEIHDAFRGTSGSYDLTMRAIGMLRKLGMPLQINTTVSRYNLDDLPNIARLLEGMGIVLWSVFFLVPTGRGKADDMITADEHERVFHWLADLSERVSFDIKTTEAPPYRRVMMQRGKGQELSGAPTVSAVGGGAPAATAGAACRQRRQWIRLRFPHRRCVSQRVFADRLRERAGALPIGDLSDAPDLCRPARSGAAEGEVRGVRVPFRLRRLPGPGLRRDRRSLGKRSDMRLCTPGMVAAGGVDSP